MNNKACVDQLQSNYLLLSFFLYFLSSFLVWILLPPQFAALSNNVSSQAALRAQSPVLKC